MRLQKLWLDGYGRFTDQEVALAPGFQVFVGPNERGKTTLRAFIGDMLYGQKASTQVRRYEDSHDLRRPWARPEPYGGRILYTLDNGQQYEVRRTFDRNNESIQVFNRSLARDVTGEYGKLRNHESTFAEEQLGLTKSVFLGAANITHLTLENLGDSDAMAEIREKILSLADTADESRTSESALSYVEARLTAIGKANARTKPLPKARARLKELEAEYAEAAALRRSLAELEARRQELRAEMRDAEETRRAVEREREACEYAARHALLEEVEKVETQIDQFTQTLFSLGAAREFPLEQEPELQRAVNKRDTARTQLHRSEQERATLDEQLEEERARLGFLADQSAVEVAESDEERLEELERQTADLAQRVEEFKAGAAAAQERREQAEADLASLPDFAAWAEEEGDAGSPIECVNQYAASLGERRRRCDAAAENAERTRNAVADLEARLAARASVFADFDDFAAAVDDHKLAQRLFAEKETQLESERAEAAAAEAQARKGAPLFALVAGAATVASLGLAGVAFAFERPEAHIGAGFLLLLAAYQAIRAVAARRAIGRHVTRQAAAMAELDAAREELARAAQPFEEAMRRGRVATLRELEALHGELGEARHRLAFETQARDEAAATLEREQQAVSEGVAAASRAFGRIGVALESAEAVRDAASEAVARYHEYRDARRRLDENREAPEHLAAQAAQAADTLETARAEERELALRVRQFMREQGYRDESKHTSALRAVRAHRQFCAEVRQKQERLRVIHESLDGIRRQIEQDRKELERAQAAVERLLRAAGVQSVDEWHATAAKAREYEEQWNRRAALREKKEALLGGRDLEELRAAVANPPTDVTLSGRSAEALEAEAARLAQRLSDLGKEEHALHIEATEQRAGHRPLHEIEEERASVAHTVAALALESEAASHAAAVIEQVAHDSHARIAPGLARRASEHLGHITAGTYDELLVSRDLRITVRVPETNQLNEFPERRLSKGTVDQIYLSLRLALVESLSRNGETLPLLLDDPFANYDDARFRRALDLLARLGESAQVILFTCHEDVADAAAETGAHIHRL